MLLAVDQETVIQDIIGLAQIKVGMQSRVKDTVGFGLTA
ncbi:hypothetical protein AC229_0615 [Oenococcus oeni]|nr:hypothetical protein AC229_0615 [Oenococcus oeni]